MLKAVGMTLPPFSSVSRRERAAQGPQITVIASERLAPIVVKRVTAAGYPRVTVVADTGETITQSGTARAQVVLAVLDPALLTREQLHIHDELGIHTLGLFANRRHRAWGQLLPLCEVLWLFAPPQQYRRALNALSTPRGGGAPFRLEG